MATTNKIMIGIDNQVIELTGADKEAFLADREATAQLTALFEAQYKARQDSRKSAIKKLAEVAGLTQAELDAIL